MAGAATSAATAAATPAVLSGDLVNVPAGDPATERWPSAVDPGQYGESDRDGAYPIEGPVAGGWVLDDWTGSVPEIVPGGGIQDTSWTTGTDGPQLPWDSAAGPAFAPSAAVNPDLHGTDTGAVFANQYSAPPAVGQIVRSSIPGQTYNREYVFDPVTGQNVPAPNGRANLDQQQRWDPAPGDGGGYAPWDPGYAERPIMLNVAYQATPVSEVPTQYGVSGALPDRSQFNSYASESYASPPDPQVLTSAPPAAATGGGFLLG
jgi:hypothetical protein